MQNIIIVGAGPTGLLLAHTLLAQGNDQITIYERRSDPRQVKLAQDRTFPIVLQSRGLRAIRAIPGLEAAITAQSCRSQGLAIHRAKGEPRRITRKLSTLLIDRNRLTRVLLEQLVQRYGDERLAIHFDCACVSVDVATEQVSQAVTFQPKNGEAFVAECDRLVAADGARSQVRDCLVSAGQMQCDQEIIADVYKSLFVPRISADGATQLDGDRNHTWSLGNGIRLIMAPQPDDWLHGTLIFPPDNNPLESLETAEAVLAFFQERCPALGQLMTLEEAEALRLRPVATFLTVKCDRMHWGDRVLLIGDAVHAVSPSIGQGCNASLQDVEVFAQLLEQFKDDWSQALPVFTTQRLPDVHALRELSDFSFPRSKALSVEFGLRMMLDKSLGRWLPQLVTPMSLLMNGEQSYGEVLEQTQGWISRVKQSQVEG